MRMHRGHTRNDAPQTASRPFSAPATDSCSRKGRGCSSWSARKPPERAGAKIYAEVAGYGSTCDAYHPVRLDESGEEPARAMTLAMKDAGIAPSEVGYLNYHGTSTRSE